MAPDRHTGGCGCGAVSFEVVAPLGPARYCHCTSCQRRTGTAASASAIVAPGSIEGLAELLSPCGGELQQLLGQLDCSTRREAASEAA